MDIDKTTIKALSSDTRLGILKELTSRRMMPSELSKRLGMSPSTVSDHLRILEDAQLIKRQETGHKWIYYELTSKSQYVLGSRNGSPIKFVLSIGLGLVLLLGGFANSFTANMVRSTQAPLEAVGSGEAVVDKFAPSASAIAQYTDPTVLLMIIGLALVITGILKTKY